MIDIKCLVYLLAGEKDDIPRKSRFLTPKNVRELLRVRVEE